MPVQTQCPNCNKLQEPYIDKQTEEVFCELCKKEIKANHFLKSQLKNLKQYKQKTSKPFAVKCSLCNQEETPLIVKEDVICGNCKKPLNNLSPIFKSMLKEKLKSNNE